MFRRKDTSSLGNATQTTAFLKQKKKQMKMFRPFTKLSPHNNIVILGLGDKDKKPP